MRAPSSSEEAAAWWLCYETLSMVDRELRQIRDYVGSKSSSQIAPAVAAPVAPKRRIAWIAPAIAAVTISKTTKALSTSVPAAAVRHHEPASAAGVDVMLLILRRRERRARTGTRLA